MSPAAWVLALTVVVAVPADLPSAPVRLKTHTRTFNAKDEFAISGGKIWFRPRAGGEWRLLLGTGLPTNPKVPDAEDPSEVVAIAADANALIAIGPDRRIYDAVIEDASTGKVQWNYGWGMPFRLMPKKVFLPKELRTWSYSLINDQAGYTEDLDGNAHRTIGVDTVWVVTEDGRQIRFNDPWLPPNEFEFKVSAPERGAFVVHSISGAASTLLVMDRTGRMFTRHADFDTLGGNPGIRYSYQREDRGYRPDDSMAKVRSLLPMLLDVRTLPPEPWKEQPRIPGRHTDAITIVQTGQGNAARELRVEGFGPTGELGLWVKAVNDPEWRFEATGGAAIGKEIDPAMAPEPPDSPDQCFAGLATFGRVLQNERPGTVPLHHQPAFRSRGYRTPAHLEGFNETYDPFTVKLQAPDGTPLSFTVHMQPWSFPIRRGATNRLLGMIMPAEDVKSSPTRLRAALSLPGVRELTDAYVYLTDDEVRIEADPFRQPGGEHVVFQFKRPKTPQPCARTE